MQTPAQIGHALYRIVFRGGSPQRVQYSPRLMLAAVLAFVALAIVAHRYGLGLGTLQIGVFLFSMLTGLYIASALLTRKAPRNRLRVTMLVVVLTMAGSQLLLLLGAPLVRMGEPWRFLPIVAATLVVLLGTSNSLRYAVGAGQAKALGYTGGFLLAVGSFYWVLVSLLQVVYT